MKRPLALACLAACLLSLPAAAAAQDVAIVNVRIVGGTGSVIGTVIGVFIPAVLQSGFTILQVQSFWQTVAVGAVLIVAVYFDQLRRRRRQRA